MSSIPPITIDMPVGTSIDVQHRDVLIEIRRLVGGHLSVSWKQVDPDTGHIMWRRPQGKMVAEQPWDLQILEENSEDEPAS